MRKHLLILCFQFGLAWLIFYLSKDLVLSYYFLAPILLLPPYYFFKESSRPMLILSIAVAVFTNAYYLFIDPHPRLFLYWSGQIVFLTTICLYWIELKSVLVYAVDKRNEIHKNLENLQVKYQTRIASLKHLELQVSSLMNLFEIARDFSECMDFITLSDFLLKKLKNELSFERMRIFLLHSGTGPAKKQAKIYDMTTEEVSEYERDLSEDEQVDFDTLFSAKTMVRRDQSWFFPIFEGDALTAVFSIDGVKNEDLARVEVLSAYLVLLIRKIKLYETVRELAIIDELTQVFVRHHFTERLEEEVKRSIRFKLPLTVLMLDIDHFKRYNDEFGHLVGDATLKEVADLLKKNLRRVDLVGRYGGEEFVVAMPETKIENASEVAERIRSNIARHDFQVYNDKTKVTVSQGIQVFDVASIKDPDKADISQITAELIRKADESMYRAKEEGRNRVCIYKERQGPA